MPTVAVCQSCKKEIDAPETNAGEQVKCPHCGDGLMIPGNVQEPPNPPMIPAPFTIPELQDLTARARAKYEDYDEECRNWGCDAGCEGCRLAMFAINQKKGLLASCKFDCYLSALQALAKK